MAVKKSVLLVTWDGAGNLPPQRALVRALIAAGHTVQVLSHESTREPIERNGAEFVPVRGAAHYDSREPMPPTEEMRFVLKQIWYARPFGTELLEAVERFRPDLLLVDISLSYSLVAAKSTGLPTVVLGHFPYELILGPFAPLLAPRLDEMNAYAAELGVAPFASHQALIESAPYVLIPSYRAFDALERCAPNVVHVGPCRSGYEHASPWERRLPAKPLVLVGLSTSNQSQAPLLQRLCDALADLDVEAVVTTGPAIPPDSLRAGANTTLVRYVPHDRILPAADLLVTHAGHGTVMAGLTYGVPMVCFPMGRDQPMIAARVAALGCGAVANADDPVEAIRRTLAEILGDAAMRKAVKNFARSVAEHPGLDHAVRLVQELL